MIIIQLFNSGSVELVRFMGGDNAIIEGARTCFQSDGDKESDIALLKSIVKNRHTSTLEHATFTFKVRLPLFVRDQWVRHRIGCSYNIKSLRYCKAFPDFFVPDEIKIGTFKYSLWVENNKLQFENYLNWIDFLQKDGMKIGRARELARTHLPSSIYTEMIFTCNGASLMHFLDLRDNPHAQPEIQLYAKALLQLAKTVAPITFTYYESLKLTNGKAI